MRRILHAFAPLAILMLSIAVPGRYSDGPPSRRFQVDSLLRRRGRNRKRSCLFPYETIQTLRYTLIGRAGVV